MPVFGPCSNQLRRSGLNNNTISKDQKDKSSNTIAFEERIIDSNSTDLHIWKIKINEFSDGHVFGVGIVSNLHHQNENKDFDTERIWLGIDLKKKNCNGNNGECGGRKYFEPKEKCGY